MLNSGWHATTNWHFSILPFKKNHKLRKGCWWRKKDPEEPKLCFCKKTDLVLMWPPSIAYLTRHGNCWMSFLFVLYSALRFLSQIHEILSFQEKLYKVPTAICRVSVLISLSLMYSYSRYYISLYFRNLSMTFLRWYTNTSCTVVIHHSCLLTNPYLHLSVCV